VPDPFRETSTLREVLAKITRRLVGLGILLYLVDLNSTHVRDFVSGLVRAWRDQQTLTEMSAIAAALDAEHVSLHRYPDSSELAGFIRQWIPDTRGRDPSVDHWGVPFRLELEEEDSASVGYVLRSCGPDRICGTEDDITRRGSSRLE
jgi:hypothetical protein